MFWSVLSLHNLVVKDVIEYRSSFKALEIIRDKTKTLEILELSQYSWFSLVTSEGL